MDNSLYIEMSHPQGNVIYRFTIIDESRCYFKVLLGSANMSLIKKDKRWKTLSDDPKPTYHSPEEIGEAILDKLKNM